MHFQARQQIYFIMESLRDKPPPTMTLNEWKDTIGRIPRRTAVNGRYAMTKIEWGIAAGWTEMVTSNCLIKDYVKLDDIRRFHRELEEKTKGNVDMTTLFWIWDQVAIISKIGKDYTEKWKPVMIGDIQRGHASM
jgi:hypothetical protein